MEYRGERKERRTEERERRGERKERREKGKENRREGKGEKESKWRGELTRVMGTENIRGKGEKKRAEN